VPGELNNAALRERFVGDVSESFWVPAFQRGYRWGAHEVRRLLDDIWESKGSPYYLQPVVVKELSDGRWELIDGQQRLTTLYLIFKFMKEASLQNASAAFSLDYETRPEMKGYLADPSTVTGQDNIDSFHVADAYRTIGEWFDGHEGRRQFAANKIYEYFFESVRIIWYSAPADTNSTAVFTRLNVGRIPLTDAELVKALLLTHADKAPSARGRSIEIAAQWDSIERDLRNPELWAFLTGGARADSTHISLLLDVLAAGPSSTEQLLFHTFHSLRSRIQTNPLETWDEVLDLHSLITGWFEDRNVFHRVGFLVATGHKLRSLVDLSRDRTKNEFNDLLIELIRTTLALSADEVRDLNYERRGSSLEHALLLMNVETVRRQANSSERYSFHAHASGKWSLEHVHAQNAELLTRQEQWAEWLRLHRDAVVGLPSLDEAEHDKLRQEMDDALSMQKLPQGVFRRIEASVINALGGAPDLDVHSITNLALLDSGANSALSNSVFEVKRREVLRRDKSGSYIPVCTRNVFLKYYTPDAKQQMHFWGPADRQGYLGAILEVLSPYLTEESTDA
jgi:hypothetical protein